MIKALETWPFFRPKN